MPSILLSLASRGVGKKASLKISVFFTRSKTIRRVSGFCIVGITSGAGVFLFLVYLANFQRASSNFNAFFIFSRYALLSAFLITLPLLFLAIRYTSHISSIQQRLYIYLRYLVSINALIYSLSHPYLDLGDYIYYSMALSIAFYKTITNSPIYRSSAPRVLGLCHGGKLFTIIDLNLFLSTDFQFLLGSWLSYLTKISREVIIGRQSKLQSRLRSTSLLIIRSTRLRVIKQRSIVTYLLPSLYVMVPGAKVLIRLKSSISSIRSSASASLLGPSGPPYIS